MCGSRSDIEIQHQRALQLLLRALHRFIDSRKVLRQALSVAFGVLEIGLLARTERLISAPRS
jgi:hypothetical protein